MRMLIRYGCYTVNKSFIVDCEDYLPEEHQRYLMKKYYGTNNPVDGIAHNVYCPYCRDMHPCHVVGVEYT